MRATLGLGEILLFQNRCREARKVLGKLSTEHEILEQVRQCGRSAR